MSNPFGGFGGGSIAIHQDSTENMANAAIRKTKRDEANVKAPANKRAALGIITNSSRIQPFRAAKQNTLSDGSGGFVQNENLQTKAAKTAFAVSEQTVHSQGFSIHVDDESSQPTFTQLRTSVPSENTIQLNPAVLRPLSILSENSKPEETSPFQIDSPMLLDTSVDIHQIKEETEEERFNRVLTVPEYSDDIYRYLREAEQRNRSKPNYMKKQPDITSSMRSILVDWLVEVADEYKLHRETLCLSVNYIDRFLSQMSVLRGKLQLVGAACMFVASKYEEIYPPEVGEFVYITDDTYSKKQVLRMEHLILKVLSFDVAVPTVNCFAEKLLKDLGADDRTCSLAMYLCELTLVDAETYLKYLPSEIAAAAVCLANHTLGQVPWPARMIQTTAYQVSDFEDCLKDLYMTFCRAPNHPQQAVREKYKDKKYHQVSLLCPPPIMPQEVH